jgi:hypothetical protein
LAESTASPAPIFSLVYCFFVNMGGFVVDVREIDDKHGYLTLTSQTLEECARRGKLFKMNESEITDKSKADVLAKGLVCLQVTWMLIECIARNIAGYPLTTLEVYTFVHVFCALVMYGLWIKVSLLFKLNHVIHDCLPCHFGKFLTCTRTIGSRASHEDLA